jgi:signal transduction histidine kinase
VEATGSGIATGAYRQQLRDSARPYVLWFRCVALCTCCLLGALTGGPAAWGVAAVAVGLTLVQVVAMSRGVIAGLGPYADLSLAVALGAGQVWLGPAGTGDWLFAVVAILTVTCHYEWSSRPALSWAIAGVSIASYVLFHRLAGGAPSVFTFLRLLLQSLLSYFGLLLLHAGARQADEQAERAARSRMETASGDLRRHAERAFLATLHDTACTTFLAIATAGAGRLEWVRGQCARDLRTLTDSRQMICDGTGRTDLTALLSRLREHRDLEVRLDLADRIIVARAVADAISLGVAEALTNVARHSGDSHPEVSATTGDGWVRVAVQDDGAGFTPADPRSAGRGIRESIVHRAELAGIGVTLTSTPGRGTRVEWTCPSGPSPGPDAPGDAAQDVAVDLVRPVRVAALAVCLVVQFALTAPNFVRDVARGLATPTSIVVFGYLAVLGVWASVLILRGRPVPSTAAWVGGSLLLACSLAMSADLPVEVLSRGEHWSFGLVGWYSLVVLFDLAVGVRLLFLALHAMILAVPVFVGPGGLEAAATMWVFIVSVTGMQAWVVLATGVVRSFAARAGGHVREAADLRLARHSAEVTQREHRRRYEDIRGTTVPLLQELATGLLDPACGQAKGRCALEATRLRRLMSSADRPDDALQHEVRAIVDDLDRRGIQVQLSLKGPPVPVPRTIRGVLLEPVVAAIVAARTTARLTILRGEGAIRVSALCTGIPADWEPPPADPRVRVSTTINQGTLWLETVWTGTI